jgi:hypothetical protein
MSNKIRFKYLKTNKSLANIYNTQLRHVSWIEYAPYIVDLNQILQTGGGYRPDFEDFYDVTIFGESGKKLLEMLSHMEDVPAEVFDNPGAFSADFIVKNELGNGEFEYIENSYKLKDTSLWLCEHTDTIQVSGGAFPFEDQVLPEIQPTVENCGRVDIQIRRLQ